MADIYQWFRLSSACRVVWYRRKIWSTVLDNSFCSLLAAVAVLWFIEVFLDQLEKYGNNSIIYVKIQEDKRLA